MPAELIIDTVRDTELEKRLVGSFIEKVIIRTGVVKNLVLPSGTPDSEILAQLEGVTGMPAMNDVAPGYPDNANSPRLRVMGARVINATTFHVNFRYANVGFGGLTPSQYIIRSRSALMPMKTNHTLDASRTPIRCGLFIPAKKVNLPMDAITFMVPRPVRQYSIYSLIYGDSAAQVAKGDYIGYVNHDTWKGKAKGFWRIEGWDTDEMVYSGYTTVEATVMSYLQFDHSLVQFYRDHKTGRLVEPDPPSSYTSGMSRPYKFGIIYPDPGTYGSDTSLDGFIRVGFHDLCNFPTVLGVPA